MLLVKGKFTSLAAASKHHVSCKNIPEVAFTLKSNQEEWDTPEVES